MWVLRVWKRTRVPCQAVAHGGGSASTGDARRDGGDALRFGVGVWQGVSSRRLSELATLVEDEGFDQLWYSNHKLYRDLWVGMAIAAPATRHLSLGSFVAEPYSQHPAERPAA